MTEGFRSGLKRVWFGSRRHCSGKYAGLYVVEQCAGCNARDAGDRFLPVPGRSGRVNALYYGDCLTVMQELPAGSVDLIYLDPPFNSARNYHASYEDETGRPLPDRIEAFCDMWTLTEERERDIRNMPIVARETGVSDDVPEFWKAWMGALRKTNPALLAYLSYMVLRLARMRVLLRPTGSLYVHCDPTAAHYIKVVLDGLFGHDRFRNEIVWRRAGRTTTRGGSAVFTTRCWPTAAPTTQSGTASGRPSIRSTSSERTAIRTGVDGTAPRRSTPAACRAEVTSTNSGASSGCGATPSIECGSSSRAI